MRSEVVVICEGSSDAAFVSRFLALRGYSDNRKVRILNFPAGKGCGEQFVREKYPVELKALRRWQNKALVVMIDADTRTVQNRKLQLEKACDELGVARRTASEHVVLAVPKRNSETWFVYLNGENWSEDENYWKRKDDTLAKRSAELLHDMCYRQQSLVKPAPPSIEEACEEWRRF